MSDPRYDQPALDLPIVYRCSACSFASNTPTSWWHARHRSGPFGHPISERCPGEPIEGWFVAKPQPEATT